MQRNWINLKLRNINYSTQQKQGRWSYLYKGIQVLLE